GVLTRVLGDNGAEGTPTGNKLVAEAVAGPTNPPIGAGGDGNGGAATSGASAAGDNGGAAITGPAVIGGGVRNVTAAPIVANYSGDGSWSHALITIPAVTARS
ncbi:unnamed protein product, partial [Penicillium nalgiovense]